MNPKELHEIAKEIDLSERAVQRLLGSVKIPRGKGEADSVGSDLGLRLAKTLRGKLDDGSKRQLVAVLREYRSCCPKIVAWIGRGDFRALYPPNEVTPAMVLHASRTVGRLRATFLRESFASAGPDGLPADE